MNMTSHQERRICDVTCEQNCRSKINEHSRLQISKYFSDLEDKRLRQYFVQKCVLEDEDIGRKRYFFTVNSVRHEVCRSFFINTLNISHAFVSRSLRILFQLHEASETDPKMLEGVLNHIKSVPRLVHCELNENKEMEYVESSVKVESMFEFYKKYAAKHNYPVASFEYYLREFKEKEKLFVAFRDSLPVLEEDEISVVALKVPRRKHK